MNKIIDFVITVQGKGRHEKRNKIGQWVQDFVHHDPDCEGVRIIQINLPENEQIVYWTILAYGQYYFWIDCLKDGMPFMSRLERIKGKSIEILFTDDYGVDPYLPVVIGAERQYGKEILFPKPGQEIKQEL